MRARTELSTNAHHLSEFGYVLSTMDSLSLTTATTSNASKFTFSTQNSRNLPFPRKQRKSVVFALKDDNKHSSWDQIGLKFGKLIGENPKLTLAKINNRKPIPKQDSIKRPSELIAKAPNNPRHSVPNVILRKAASREDGVGTNTSPRLSLKPNLSLKMSKERDSEQFSDMILVRNLETSMKNGKVEYMSTRLSLLQKPENMVDEAYRDDNGSRSKNLELTSTIKIMENDLFTGSQPSEHIEIGRAKKSCGSTNLEADSVTIVSSDATLQRPPKRLDQPVKEASKIGGGRNTRVENLIPNAGTSEDLPPSPHLKDREDIDWKRAEDLIITTGREEVELISCSTRGFVVSFGSLIGFLPYRNLVTKWKYLAFESWLRRKGLDPATYKKNLSDATSTVTSTNPTLDPKKMEDKTWQDMKLEDLLAIYDQEKLNYLSSFVGQKIKVNVILANRESRKLIFSVKPKEKEESIERKRNLMAKLSVGDIVKCCIKKITYFGIFVELEGVPALIHQTEVSWDATLNPTSSFKIGQVVEAKVHQLDFSFERISLSLKEITPDPLTEALEAVLGDRAFLDGRSEADQPENKWADLELLVKELRRYDGIELVAKGRFFLSPGLTPAFQVYMASMFKNCYKLLARAGNKVQEVMVHTSLDTEGMKRAILACTKRVE